MYARLKQSRLGRLLAPLLLDAERRVRFRALPSNIRAHNLAKGIPFPDNSVDVVYHSHVLEHLDREIAEKFMHEVRRVLRPHGIQRIVVPDFEHLCRDYLLHISLSEQSSHERYRHDEYVAAIIEQSVRKAAFSTKYKKPLRRFIEQLVLGDARRRGETHQWMYDRINLPVLLERTGFHHITILSYNTSNIPDWEQYGLDVDADGRQYKPGSLYVEARK